ncbi:MAG: OadG family protein [Clostridia bacterium]|nr:OadG family protein [Clostridia bacterium]
MGIEFHARGFLDGLKYMGIGMLGIFIVMGVIIGSVYLLNKAFKPRKKKNKDDNAQ